MPNYMFQPSAEKIGGFMKIMLVVVLLSSMLFGQILYEEHFTDGNMQLDWRPWFTDAGGIGDSMGVISDPTTPGGDGWAGRISNEYMTVAGLTYAGDNNLTDYSIEAWIYTEVAAALGPYNGIAIRMDSSIRYYYRLVSDFDSDGRIRLGFLGSGGYPTIIRDWTSGEIPGGVPATSSWHKFKLKMVADSIWCYYDDSLLADCPFMHDSVANGFFGVYTFNMMDTASTRCDDIVVMDEGAGVAEHGAVAIESFTAYPNPFRDNVNITYSKGHRAEGRELVIYDAAGRLVKQFDYTTIGLSNHISWNGKDSAGNALAPGVYFISEKNSDILVKVVKLD